jgi:hypothetical protein
MGSQSQHAVKLEVEQTTLGRLKGVLPPAEMDGGSTIEMEGDHVAGLTEAPQ